MLYWFNSLPFDSQLVEMSIQARTERIRLRDHNEHIPVLYSACTHFGMLTSRSLSCRVPPTLNCIALVVGGRSSL